MSNAGNQQDERSGTPRPMSVHPPAAELPEVEYVPPPLRALGLRGDCTSRQAEESFRNRLAETVLDVTGSEAERERLRRALDQTLAFIKQRDAQGPPPGQGRYVPVSPATGAASSAPQRKRGIHSSGGTLLSNERLITRFESGMRLHISIGADPPKRVRYLAGGPRAWVPATVAFTDRRCIFRSEHLARRRVILARVIPTPLHKRRYCCIRGELGLFHCHRILHRSQGAIVARFDAHGQLRDEFPSHDVWVLEFRDPPAEAASLLADLLAESRGLTPRTDAAGHVETSHR